MKRKINTKEELDILIEKYNNKESMQDIAKYFGVHVQTVRNRLKELNIYDKNRRNRKHYCDFSFFENIDTEEKAYWLGYIAADGNIYSNEQRKNKSSGSTLKIISKDKDHLEKFKKSIKADNEIEEVISFKGYSNGNKVYRIQIYSNKMCDDLIKLGIIPNKSLILKPPIINEKFYKDFIRGYFDGDGSIYKLKSNFGFNILGTKEMLEWIIKVLDIDTKIKKDYRTGDKNNYYISVAGIKKPYKIYKQFYEDSKIYLDRKYQLYQQLKQNVEQ